MVNNKIKVALVACIVALAFILANFDFRFDRFGNAKINWLDCVQINNTKYFRVYPDIIVEESFLGAKIGEVTFNVSENVGNGKYRFRNGDATVLKKGTEIYKINTINNAIAVKIGEQYHLYNKKE